MSFSTQLEGRLRFRHMRMLVEIERRGSVREAAVAMHVTQPALSKSLAELERALGAPLYQRTPRGLVATPEGTVATRWAVSILNELQTLADQTAAVAGDRKLLLRVGTVPFLSSTLLPITLAQMREAGALLRVLHTESRVPDLLEALAAGQLDVIMTPYTPGIRMQTEEQRLVFHDLYAELLGVFVAPGHPLAASGRLDWRDIDRQEWVVPPRPSLLRELFDEVIARRVFRRPSPMMESTTISAIIACVEMGLGIGVAPTTALRAGLREGTLRRLAVPDDMHLPVALIHREAAQGQPPIEIFRHHAQAALPEFVRQFRAHTEEDQD